MSDLTLNELVQNTWCKRNVFIQGRHIVVELNHTVLNQTFVVRVAYNLEGLDRMVKAGEKSLSKAVEAFLDPQGEK